MNYKISSLHLTIFRLPPLFRHSMKYFGIFLLLASSLLAQESSPIDAPAQIDPTATRELIRQWVQTERLLSEEKTTWQVEKSRMQELLDIYQKELKLLNEEITQAGSSTEMVDERKQTHEKELKEYRDAQRLLSDAMARHLPRVRKLLTQLPEPLLEKIDADMDVLQAKDALEKPRDVLKSMLVVMAESGRFNRSITVAEETRELPSGKKMTVDVIYLGLAQAFYAAEQGDTAGVGRPSPIGTGWQWQEQPKLAKDIRAAIAVERKDSPPQLISLPIQISNASNTQSK